jgi:nitrate reductase alpha subunit
LTKSYRRQFLKVAAGTAASAALLSQLEWATSALNFLEPISVGNPLATYPNRNWEEVYRNQYRFDSTFTFVCAPNDTHNCRLRAYVRNGVMTRIEQAYDVAGYRDLDGNTTNPIWHPRGCLKGYTITRRIYGPYRIKYPMVRKGWKEWVEAGFPDPLTPDNQARYFQRGLDSWVKVSWDEAFALVATALVQIAAKYSGAEGAALLATQGYAPEMIEAMHEAGTQTMKLRPGMSLLGVTRLLGLARFANMLVLLDAKERNVAPEETRGARIWSNYTWHGDLDPGTPMVTGVQTFDPELNDFRHAKLLVFVGKNMVENKMADAHWWIEVMERGGRIVNISPEYSPASQKADYWIPIRPGTDTALLLGVAQVLIAEKLYDAEFVKKFTDLPLLVRADTLKLLRASDILPAYENKKLENYTDVQVIPETLREEWGDFAVWDARVNAPAVVTRDDVGDWLAKGGIDPALEGTFTVQTVNGQSVEVKPVFQLYRELATEYDLDTVADLTSAPKPLIEQLARDFAAVKPAQIHTGEGTNHYFHCDLKDRASWLVLALTGNVGKPGANKGHWAGNYKSAVFGVGLLPYIGEDPFEITLDPAAPGQQIKTHVYYKKEEPAYWNYNDRPLIVDTPDQGRKVFTGQTHMPTPTKVEWYVNTNHLNNAKWAYNMLATVHPKVEMIVYHDWEWTATCEYADVVFPVHSWAELTLPEMTASCSNPFLQVWRGGLQPLFDTKQDNEVMAGVAAKLAELTGDERFRDYWKFVLEGRNEVYLQRILDVAPTTQGYRIEELLKSETGWLMMFRTYPRIPGWEQINESKPFYTKTGRLEFYREEPEFIEYGENLLVHREPVEATPYLPNVIVSTHPWIRPDDYGISQDATTVDERSVRNTKLAWSEVRKTQNFLWAQGYRFYCLTPKTRHRVHSSWSVADWNLIWDSNFGDPMRMDKRTPGVGEHQMHMNPDDAKELGINDGDYAWVDANPADRPYLGWKPDDPLYKVARLKLRVKYNPAYPRGVTMIKHAPFMATHKSVRAHETRPDGLARSEDTGYQANLRYGSQQALTRGYLQPTMMTDSLVRKDLYGQKIGQGYEIDVHAPNTCPKETLVKITKAEDGGLGGVGVWEPARTGFTPGNENDQMRKYLAGEFIRTQEAQ